MLQAKTEEQINHIEEVADRHLKSMQTYCCKYIHSYVYANEREAVEINMICEDCNNHFSIDIPFAMMAEIVDYLRSQNNK